MAATNVMMLELEEFLNWTEWTKLNEVNGGTWARCHELNWTIFPDKLVPRELNYTELMPNHFELWTRRPFEFTNSSGPGWYVYQTKDLEVFYRWTPSKLFPIFSPTTISIVMRINISKNSFSESKHIPVQMHKDWLNIVDRSITSLATSKLR